MEDFSGGRHIWFMNGETIVGTQTFEANLNPASTWLIQ